MTGLAGSLTHEPFNKASVMTMTAELQATQSTETPATPAPLLPRLARPLLGLVPPLLFAGGWELVV